MLRSTPRFALLTLCLFAHAGLASAQPATPPQTQTQPAPRATTPAQPAQQQRPSDAPPQLERIEPGSDAPATTIPPRKGTVITEKRGKTARSPKSKCRAAQARYTMKPNVAPGNAQPGDIHGQQHPRPTMASDGIRLRQSQETEHRRAASRCGASPRRAAGRSRPAPSAAAARARADHQTMIPPAASARQCRGHRPLSFLLAHGSFYRGLHWTTFTSGSSSFPSAKPSGAQGHRLRHRKQQFLPDARSAASTC